MTLWHKRLIKFIFKFIGALVVIMMIGLFFYYNLFYKKDNLLKFVPAEAVAYLALKADESFTNLPAVKQLLNDWQADNKLMLDFKSLNFLVGNNLAVAIIPENQTLKYLAIFDLKNQQGNIDSYLNWLNQHNLAYTILTASALEKQILLVSDSQQVIDLAKKCSMQEHQSLADRINVVINLKQIDYQYNGKAYLNLQEVAKYWQASSSLTYKLLASRLSKERNNDLFLTLKIEDNKLLLQTAGQEKAGSASEPRFITQIPTDTWLMANLTQANQDLTSSLDNLSQVDPESAKQVSLKLEYLEKRLNFNFEADLLATLKQPSGLVLTSDNKWLFYLDLAKNGDPATQIAKINQIGLEYLAYFHPTAKTKIMPDKTAIKQIVKDISAVKEQEVEINGFKLALLEKDGEQLGYYLDNKVLILGNDQELLQRAMNKADFQPIQQISSCQADNSTNFSQNIMVSGLTLGQINPNFRYLKWLNLGLELTDYPKIWLCLE